MSDSAAPARTAQARRLPVTLIGGYLGAGKTTLVNRLLRAAGGRRLAVLVNDFGDINIDADLIESQSDGVINLAGGCVCCSFGSDLMGTLLDVGRMTPAPDQVLLETSGVAQPSAVARALRLAPGLTLDATLVLADAETLREKADDRYVGDTVRSQLSDADLIVVNKTDLVDEPALEALLAWLATVAPGASCTTAVRSAIDPALVFADLRPDAAAARPDVDPAPARRADNEPAALFTSGPIRAPGRDRLARETFESASLEFDGRVDAQALAAALAAPELALYRAKGLMLDRDGRPVSLQVVGRRFEVAAAPGAPAAVKAPLEPAPVGATSPVARGRLVCIGPRGTVRIGQIRACLAAAMATH